MTAVRFGRYRLVQRLGVGGTAEIWRAVVTGSRGVEHSVIIKRLRPELARDPVFTEMLAAEARISSRLDHPAIVKVFESGEAAGELYLAMEVVDGWELSEVHDRARRRRRPLSVGLVCHVVAEVADALAYAHALVDEQGRPLHAVHRDINPGNIMLTRQGAVKLVDFGMARFGDRDPDEATATGIRKGTPAYMSPEQADGLDIDHRTDVFSLGIVLHEGLTGRRLFRGATALDTLRRVRDADVAPPSTLAAGIGPDLDAIVMRMLAADPADRYADCADIARSLRAIARRHQADAAALRDALTELQLERPAAPPPVQRRATARFDSDAPVRRPWLLAGAITALIASPYAIPRPARSVGDALRAVAPAPAAVRSAARAPRASAEQDPLQTPTDTRTPGTPRP
jgi:serine/threonine protein kinase